jgi:hypothetical protein
MRATAFLLGVGFACPQALGENIDPANDGSQYAWAENVGWFNAEPASCSGCGVQVTDFELTGWLWGENIGWINLSCTNNSTCGTVSYGVINDGHGNLGGFAWAENAGWLNFAPATSSASIDPTSGEFSGYAWAENLGWVSLSCTNTATCGTTDYGIKTDWCQAVGASPTGTPDVDAAKNGNDIDLSWPALVGADWYEIVQGDLSTLTPSGDYSTATDLCPVDNETGLTATISGTPSVGDGFWFLVRGVNCKGKGTHDSGGAGQSGLRDAEIAGSGNDCP